MSGPAVGFFCSELVQPCVLLVRPLRRPESFAALAGTWDDGRWECAARLEPADDTLLPEGAGAADAGPPPRPPAPLSVTTASGGATDIGTVRQENQDALLLNENNRLWAVADGMGGHRRAGVASHMVIDALNALEPTASLNERCIRSARH